MLFRNLIVVCLLSVFVRVGLAGNLIVHEWGTFTSLQDENGNAIGGINTDDEPVPSFVHNVAAGLLLPAGNQSKSVARCHPDVTMRLETPVMYFYPPPDFNSRFDVTVKFSNGWITQFYPKAIVAAPGLDQRGFGYLRPGTIGEAEWGNISLSSEEDLPATNSGVWLAPRRTKSATIGCNGEREKFLFYRGVGNVDAPLRVVRTGPELTITKMNSDIDDLWLVDVRPDGAMAFRLIHPFNQVSASVLKASAEFAPGDYSMAQAEELKTALHEALVAAGLFDDEAKALLETWQASYFKSPGMRLFFLVPRGWTDSTLPLEISFPENCPCRKGQKSNQGVEVSAEITRVMVGRIELITSGQRALLSEIAAGGADSSTSDLKKSKGGLSDDQSKQLASIYEQLGRFRNALILDEQKRRPTAELDQFIKNFQLQGYKY